MRLEVEGRVVGPVEVLRARRDRGRGMLGRDGVEGAVLLDPCRSVHTFGMRFAIDVAFCDADGMVLRTVRLRPNRLGPTIWRARTVLEAEAGAFDRWGLVVGARLAVT